MIRAAVFTVVLLSLTACSQGASSDLDDTSTQGSISDASLFERVDQDLNEERSRDEIRRAFSSIGMSASDTEFLIEHFYDELATQQRLFIWPHASLRLTSTAIEADADHNQLSAPQTMRALNHGHLDLSEHNQLVAQHSFARIRFLLASTRFQQLFNANIYMLDACHFAGGAQTPMPTQYYDFYQRIRYFPGTQLHQGDSSQSHQGEAWTPHNSDAYGSWIDIRADIWQDPMAQQFLPLLSHELMHNNGYTHRSDDCLDLDWLAPSDLPYYVQTLLLGNTRYQNGSRQGQIRSVRDHYFGEQ